MDRNYKFYIIDFEFGMFRRHDIVLVSGAISGSLDKDQVIKFEGTPLILGKKYTQLLTKSLWSPFVSGVLKIFEGKEEKAYPLLAELHDSQFAIEMESLVHFCE